MLKKINLIAAIAFGSAAMIASCKKTDLQNDLSAPRTSAVAELPDELGDTSDFIDPQTKGYLVWLTDGSYGARNFHQGTVADLTDTTQWATKAGTYYYSFYDHDGLSGAGTSNYSFKFTGSATGDLIVDTSRFQLRYFNTAYPSVTDTTGSINIAAGLAGYNPGPSAANVGWYAYNISIHTVTAYGPRTYILINKSTQASWKLAINSIYWNETPAGSPYPTNYPYYSFNYKQLH